MTSPKPSVHIILLGALFLGAASLAPSAQAQSCPNADIFVQSSYPASGATGVPTNAPLYVYGPDLSATSADVTLTGGSAAVSFDVVATDGGLFIDAFLGFTPNTRYTLTVTQGGEEWSETFTTGAGPGTPVQLEAPDVEVSVFNQNMGSCGVVSGICVHGEAPPRQTLEVIVGGEVMSLGSGQPGPVFPPLAAAIAGGACIDVRLREPSGVVSPATRFCGGQAARFELDANLAVPQSCQAFIDAGESDSGDSGGCGLGASGTASGAAGSLLGLATLLFVRQRRRAR